MERDNDRFTSLQKAFSLGFLISREGFNGECDCEHCAPERLEADHITIEEFFEHIEKNESFKGLRAEAMDLFKNEKD